MSRNLKGSLFLVAAAFVWGLAFVAQKDAADGMGVFSFTFARSSITCITLLPVCLVRFKRSRAGGAPGVRAHIKTGLVMGILLFASIVAQQMGLSLGTSASKSGFITALYIVIVPLLGVFIKKKIPKITWLCVGIAVVGFYLLCVKEGFSVSAGDLLVLCCAFFFSIHIMVIDYFNGKQVDGVRMSCIQFLVAGLISLVLMLVFEQPSLENLWAAKGSILYAGVLSCGVAYTLQILGQRDTEPTTATLILSLESVFAALSGWALLHETLSFKELAGCALVFAAVILAQIPLPVKAKKD